MLFFVVTVPLNSPQVYPYIPNIVLVETIMNTAINSQVTYGNSVGISMKKIVSGGLLLPTSVLQPWTCLVLPHPNTNQARS